MFDSVPHMENDDDLNGFSDRSPEAHFYSKNECTKALMCDQSSISSSPRSRDTSLPALHTIQQVAPRSLDDRPRKPRLEHKRIGRHATPRGAAIWWPVQKLREWINLSSRHTIRCFSFTSLIYLLPRYSTSNNVKPVQFF